MNGLNILSEQLTRHLDTCTQCENLIVNSVVSLAESRTNIKIKTGKTTDSRLAGVKTKDDTDKSSRLPQLNACLRLRLGIASHHLVGN